MVAIKGALRGGTLSQRYTGNEVERITGVSRRQLNYWARLRLVEPRARWGERFYSFSDLVALETIKRLATRRIPARRLRRAILALQKQLGQNAARLSELRVATNGREIVVIPAATASPPIEPLTGQFVLQFETQRLARRVRMRSSRSAEEWFEIGMACDSAAETMSRAIEAYRRALHLAPDWVEAHLNLGTALYLVDRMEESRQAFARAVELDPNNPLAEFNLGCVLEHLGLHDAAIEHLERTVALAPTMADAHLNLALAYDQREDKQGARKHLSLYLRYEPQGPWAEFARSETRPNRAPNDSAKVTPFGKSS